MPGQIQNPGSAKRTIWNVFTEPVFQMGHQTLWENGRGTCWSNKRLELGWHQPSAS